MTANSELRNAIDYWAYQKSASTIAQRFQLDLLSNLTFVKIWFQEMRTLRKQQLAIVTVTLKELGIPYVEPQGSFFIWIDLKEFMGDTISFDAEGALYTTLLKEYKLFFTKGETFIPAKREDGTTAGFFRICYAAIDEGALRAAMEALKRFVNDSRK